jgi:hypothetical protein
MIIEKTSRHRSGFLLAVIFVSLLSGFGLITAQERDASVEGGMENVDGLENWSYGVDVNQLDPGTYNFIVEGTDRAGNTTQSEPINLYVDPESDKPVVGISHPVEGSTVPGMLNIIGTAGDDDGVALVEVKINEGRFSPAEGTEFWSYYLDTSGLSDGPCLLTVRSKDINGVVGNEKTLEFILDRTLPLNEIESHKNGELIHGKIQLQGKSLDGNRIARVEMSLDGENYKPVSWKQKKKDDFAAFHFKLDSEALDDGAQIVWIRSTDKSGSAGISSFLLFIDNNPPQLDLIYPGEEISLDRQFTIAGTALDDIGLASLSYRIGRGEPVEVPLIPGDPYWSASFNLEGEKKADIRFLLTDLTGNTAEYRFQRDLDLEADKPVVELISPLADSPSSRPYFSGFLSDDDGAAQIFYSLDGGEYQRKACSTSFHIPLDSLEPGLHKLEYYGVDRFGAESGRMKTEFSVLGEGPHTALSDITPLEGDVSLTYEQGLELEPETWKALNGTVEFHNGSVQASYSLDGSEAKALSLKNDPAGFKTFSLPLKNILPGYHTLLVNAQDKAGLTEEREFYFVINGAGDRRLFYADDRFTPAGKLKNPALSMEQKDRVTFLWQGDAPAEASLSGDFPFLSLSVKGNRILLESRDEGFAEGVSLSVTTKSGKETVLGPFTIIADSRDPELSLNFPEDRVFGSADFPLSGTAQDANDIEELSYSLDGGRAVPLELIDGAFETVLVPSEISEGNRILTVRAKDRSGRITEKTVLFKKDGTPLKLTQYAPQKDRGTNGAISFIGQIDDPEMLATVEFASDGINFTALDASAWVRNQFILSSPSAEEAPAEAPVEGEAAVVPVEGEPAPVSEGPLFRLTDKAGNVTLFKPDVLIDLQGDKPVVLIQIPEENALIQKDFTLSGMAFDDDEVDSLYYRLDGGEEMPLGGKSSFELTLPVKNLTDNEHLVEIRAVDRNGVSGDWTGLNFRVSTAEPSSQMELPVIGKSIRGLVEISGYSEDANGLDRVYISFDNGNSYNLMETKDVPETEIPRVSWSHRFNTKQLADGNHSLLIKSVDRYGIPGLYTSLLTIDNKAPSLEVRQPREGVECTGSVDLEGFVYDEGELARSYVDITSLENSEQTDRIILSLDSLVRTSLDLSGMPEGWVNLRISAEDVTGNVTHISRNVKHVESVPERRVTLLTPVSGASLAGDILVQGMVENADTLVSAEIFLDGSRKGEGEIKDSGFFSALLSKDGLTEGEHNLSVKVKTGQGDILESEVSRFVFNRIGPWISLDNFSAGDYAADRPWIAGTAGYDYVLPALDDKEIKAFEKSKAVKQVEISLDNGLSFQPVSGREEWKYRLETQELGNGELWVLLRARFADDTTATVKTVLIVDETAPQVELLTPDEGSRFNDLALFTGTAQDENGLKSVRALLREGNKNQYQVPAFIQGLFIDFHFLGSTYYEGGVGLTFFEDNVKLQLLGGQAPPGRFHGYTGGVKLLANVAALPWDYFFGYDFERFSSSLAVGTVFQYFSMDEDALIGDRGVALGAMLAQAELIKYEIPKRKMFSSFSLYVEMQFWVISSDVDAGIEPRMALGIRTDIF